jgi:protein-disulfide isomerase
VRILACALAALVVSVPAAGAASRSPAAGPQDVSALLRGIPQHGAWLGRPGAPLTVVEYVDLQCPYCAKFGRETFPTLVRTYVRTGRVRMLFRGLAFLGPDSQTALRWTFAAGRQNRLWNVLELLFAKQGRENSGWVTPSLLTRVARSVPGLDTARLRRDSARVTSEIAAAAAAAKAARVPGTPYLEVGSSLMTMQPLRLRSFDPKDLAAQIDALLHE